MQEKLIKLYCSLIVDKNKRKKVRDFLRTNSFPDTLNEQWTKLLHSSDNQFIIEDNCISIQGIRFKKTNINGGINEIFGRRDYEFGTLTDSIFIDVGANVGDSALYAALNPDIKKVYSYEPFKTTYNMALENIDLNPELKQKILIYNYGWGEKDCEINITEFEESGSSINSTSDFFLQSCKEKRKNSFAKVVIKEAAGILKNIMINNPKCNFILKMDIEGTEYDCFHNLQKNDLLKYIDVIFLEWHKRGYEELTDILEKNSFIWFNEKFHQDIGFIKAVNTNKKMIDFI